MCGKTNNLGGQRYVLVTAARNEAAYIEKTILSVLSQRLQPMKWIIVNDGSEDNTEEIIARYVASAPFVELISIKSPPRRNFASKVYALNTGAAALRAYDYGFVGHLDADVSFSSGY